MNVLKALRFCRAFFILELRKIIESAKSKISKTFSQRANRVNTTKILGEAVGIQNQGIIDRTETQTNDGLTSAIITGRFKRGRVDKPMTIHQGNIRGQLGYEPTNIDYQAVQDCLDTGVPSVQVLRVGVVVGGG